MRQKNEKSKWIVFALLTGALVLLSWIVLDVPEWMANQYYLKEPKDWAAQVSANRTVLVNLIGGLAVGLTIYFTAKTYQLTQERLVTETTAKALEQLSSDNVSTRLGAVHILGRIAKGHEESYFAIVQILVAYVRQSSDKQPPGFPVPQARRFSGPADLQTALTIVGERYFSDPKDYSIDLSNMRIHNMWLPYVDFSGVYCWNAEYQDVMLAGANLSGADLTGSRFDQCDFKDVNFENADLTGVSITRPENLTKPQLAKANNVPEAVLKQL